MDPTDEAEPGESAASSDGDEIEDSPEVRTALTVALHDELHADTGRGVRWFVGVVCALVVAGFLTMFVYVWLSR